MCSVSLLNKGIFGIGNGDSGMFNILKYLANGSSLQEQNQVNTYLHFCTLTRKPLWIPLLIIDNKYEKKDTEENRQKSSGVHEVYFLKLLQGKSVLGKEKCLVSQK